MADLGPWRFGNSIFRAAVDMMRDCFFAADSQSIVKGDRIPWAKYDRFDIIHAGSDLQSDLRGDSNSVNDGMSSFESPRRSLWRSLPAWMMSKRSYLAHGMRSPFTIDCESAAKKQSRIMSTAARKMLLPNRHGPRSAMSCRW